MQATTWPNLSGAKDCLALSCYEMQSLNTTRDMKQKWERRLSISGMSPQFHSGVVGKRDDFDGAFLVVLNASK
jgi:hypothetical protein